MNEAVGEIAVVTGASRGIGRAVAEALAEQGLQVLGCGRGAKPDGLPSGVAWKTANVSDPDDIAALRRAADEIPGRVSVLVNNAGIQIEKDATQTTDEDWDLLVGTNCRGVFNACREFIPSMQATGGGSIVNIGSISGMTADPGLAIYNASKGFVHAFTRSIAVDHGPSIRCNAVCPGWIMTEMADAAFDCSRHPEAARSDALSRHPAGRFGSPNDIARTVVWLASGDSGFTTGQCITVDGGLTAASPIRTDLT